MKRYMNSLRKPILPLEYFSTTIAFKEEILSEQFGDNTAIALKENKAYVYWVDLFPTPLEHLVD